ncbi:MAG: efflux RND transporter periplasmic adaptor subunit [Owenweeksia sp.]|nr:efflux RND transporter periplasmic adaptor subunit [Owenweeksia sp.]
MLKVSVGEKVNLSVKSYPGREFTGEVVAVAAKADAALKYDVEILLTNNQEKPLKAGMYATAHFDFQNSGAEVIPRSRCLVGSIQNPEVYTISDSSAQLRQITIGEVHDESVGNYFRPASW